MERENPKNEQTVQGAIQRLVHKARGERQKDSIGVVLYGDARHDRSG